MTEIPGDDRIKEKRWVGKNVDSAHGWKPELATIGSAGGWFQTQDR